MRKPSNLSWELAASLPTVGETAHRTLDRLELSSGQTLLITGAAGSVGGIATQLAVARGIRVIGSASPSDADRVRSFGASAVRYDQDLVTQVRQIARTA